MIISWFYCLRFARPMRLLYSTGRYNRRKSAMDLATIHDLGSKRRKNVVADQIMRVSDVEIDSIVSLSLWRNLIETIMWSLLTNPVEIWDRGKPRNSNWCICALIFIRRIVDMWRKGKLHMPMNKIIRFPPATLSWCHRWMNDVADISNEGRIIKYTEWRSTTHARCAVCSEVLCVWWWREYFCFG